MSLWSRIANVFRASRLDEEIAEELQAHLDEAIGHGRDPAEARRAFGPILRQRELSRDTRLIPWLDSLRADAVFGWRQLAKKKITSAAAVLSLALTIGACTSAFRLIDALLLRPLPVANPHELYNLALEGIGPEGKAQFSNEWSYPLFARMRDAARGRAELLAVAQAEPADITYGSDQEMEKAYVQHVSGAMFRSFGLRPAAGRLLSASDDVTPGAHPLAVLSDDYWARRFARDPHVIGRTFRFSDRVYEIAGVVEAPFTGTEPGTVTEVFVPTMMHPLAVRNDATFARILARIEPGVPLEPLRAQLQAIRHAVESERARGFAGVTQRTIDNMLNQKLVLESAAAGVSGMQRNLRLPLITLAVLVGMVLLIACANVANLMIAQASTRAREMALRVSIGAGRWRLVQLVLVESAILALLSAATGALFAWWSAPFVVSRVNPPDNPARLALPADFRVLGFGIALTLLVTFLFGLAPALRASAVKPASALRGGDSPHSRGRVMNTLIALQVAFCFLVIFGAGLFVATFSRLVNQSPGFSAERLLVIDAATARPQPPVFWNQVADHLRELPGVESAAMMDWPLLNGYSRNNFVSFNGAPPTEVLTYFRSVSPGWIDTMKIPLLDGRDFRPSETSPGAAIVNETFAKTYFEGRSPVGSWFGRTNGSVRYQIVGMVRDVTYRNPREAMLPIAFVPFQSIDAKGGPRPLDEGSFMVRTAAANPLALAPILRREIPRVRPEFRVTNIRTQAQINLNHTVRERLLAMLGLFFAAVALLLAGVGLYGVLDDSVVQRRREIGIRIAIGARAGHIAWRVTAEALAMIGLGAIAGLGLGIAAVRSISSLLYGVSPTDPRILLLPFAVIFGAAVLAALPAVIRAVRIDPVAMLRAE